MAKWISQINPVSFVRRQKNRGDSSLRRSGVAQHSLVPATIPKHDFILRTLKRDDQCITRVELPNVETQIAWVAWFTRNAGEFVNTQPWVEWIDWALGEQTQSLVDPVAVKLLQLPV